MNSAPFFTVLLPTKNRSHLVAYAIRSVLSQTCGDFEVVVADNDDSDTRTRDVVMAFADPRVRYVRSGGLNMSENWEFALDHALGDYVTVLEDKHAYYPWALERMHGLIAETGCRVLTWDWDIYRDGKKLAYRNRHTCCARVMTPEEILTRYMTHPAKAWRYLPLMVRSCASHEVIRRIRQHPAVRRFFDETSPDVCAAVSLLAHVDRCCILDDGLGLAGYAHESNLLKWALQKGAGSYYGGSEQQLLDASVRFVPIKSPRLVQNVVYNDFLKIRQAVGGRLRGFEMEPLVYAKLCARDIAYNAVRGGRSSGEWRRLFDFVKTAGMGRLRVVLSIGAYLCREVFKWIGMRLRPAFPFTYGKVWRANDIVEAAMTLSGAQKHSIPRNGRAE